MTPHYYLVCALMCALDRKVGRAAVSVCMLAGCGVYRMSGDNSRASVEGRYYWAVLGGEGAYL